MKRILVSYEASVAAIFLWQIAASDVVRACKFDFHACYPTAGQFAVNALIWPTFLF